MRSHLPPVEIDGFDHPHALTGIPVRRRPEWGETRCSTCSGRGARNEILHLDSMRCRQAACGDCLGSGWTAARRPSTDIVMISGVPTWVERHPTPALVVVAQACNDATREDETGRELELEAA